MKRRWAALLLTAGLIAVSCGEGTSIDVIDPQATATTAPTTTVAAMTTVVPATTAVPTTTTTAVASTTTTPATTAAATTTVAATLAPRGVPFSVAAHGLHPDPLPEGGGWFGSGCSPGSDLLPDGIWWGYITELSVASISFDLGCLRFDVGPEENPIEESSWIVENENPKVRVVPVHPDAQVVCVLLDCPPEPFSLVEWLEDDGLPHGEEGTSGLWLYVNGGFVTEIGLEVLAG